MGSLQDAIRDSLASNANAAPSGAGMLDAVNQRERAARRQGWFIPAAVAAVLAACVAVAASMLTPASRDTPPTVAAPIQTSATQPQPTQPQPTELAWPRIEGVPDGQQPVSYHGVEILVPSTWKINDLVCLTPANDTVITGYPGGELCGGPPWPSDLTVAYLRELSPDNVLQSTELVAFATQEAVLDGHRVLRGTIAKDADEEGREPYVTEILVLPEQQVVVSVESTDPDEALQMLSTTRTIDVDSLGCVQNYGPLQVGASTRDGTAQRLVPGAPTGAALCLYSGGQLEQSAALTTQQTTDLTSVLNGLTPGVGTADPREVAAGLECGGEIELGYILRFTYTTGNPLDVLVRVDTCEYLAASNGTREGIVTWKLIALLTSVVPYGYGFPGLPCDAGQVYVQGQNCGA